MREILTRYGRHNIGFLWLFFEPMLFTLGVFGMWSLVKSIIPREYDIPIVAFAITGYSTVLLWRNVASRCAKAIEPNLSLLYHRNVKVIDLMAARIILEIAGATISLIVLTIIFTYLGLMKPPVDIVTSTIAWLLMSFFSVSLGIIIGTFSEFSDTFERIWHIFTYLFFPLSGALFMVHWIPHNMKELILLIPTVHCAEMLRHGYFGRIVPTYENPYYVIIVTLVFLLLGLVLLRILSIKISQND